MEVIVWPADVGSWLEKSFPGVMEDNGTTAEVAALKSRVMAAGRGVCGPVVPLVDGGPVEEVSGGSAGVEVCRSDVGVEAHVELGRGTASLSKRSSKSTRWEQ